MSTNAERGQLLALVEQTADVVAAMSGVKAQYVEAGWSNRGAEEMVLEMLRFSQAPGAK